jgi:integrase
MFSKAVEWGMLDRNPFEKGRSLLLKENNKRFRYLSEQEIVNLLNACPKPRCTDDRKIVQGEQAPYLRNFIIIALNTGMRKGEILSLSGHDLFRALECRDLPKMQERFIWILQPTLSF